jgi:hypothetical protein
MSRLLSKWWFKSVQFLDMYCILDIIVWICGGSGFGYSEFFFMRWVEWVNGYSTGVEVSVGCWVVWMEWGWGDFLMTVLDGSFSSILSKGLSVALLCLEISLYLGTTFIFAAASCRCFEMIHPIHISSKRYCDGALLSLKCELFFGDFW